MLYKLSDDFSRRAIRQASAIQISYLLWKE